MMWTTTVNIEQPITAHETQVTRFTFHAILKNDHTVLELFSAEEVRHYPPTTNAKLVWHWLKYKKEQNTVPRPVVPESLQATVLERFLETVTIEP